MNKNPNAPALNTNLIKDDVVQKNFSRLNEYFNANGQLDGFGFQDFVFTAAKSNQRISHTLGTIPLDILVVLLTGPGTVSFNLPLFTTTQLDLTSTGPCHIRFFYGLFSGSSAGTPAKADVQSFSANWGAGQVSAPAVAAAAAAGAAGARGATGATGAAGAPGTTLPPGLVIAWAGITTAPSGWLFCDGTICLVDTYPALGAALGNTYGGDGVTTFGVPNLGGIFIKGVGSQTIGSKTYSGSRGVVQGDSTAKNGLALTDNQHSHNGLNANIGSGSSGATSAMAGASTAGSVDPIAGGSTVSASTGITLSSTDAQTKPANVSMNYLIKT